MPLRLAVFDFDQTLTTVHLYNALAGDESSWRLPSPYAKTEGGQLVRMSELEALPEFQQRGGLALAAFGGSERVAQLQSFLRQLAAAGVECLICSRGLVGPVRKCLDQLGMLHFFTKVYANIGSAYGSTQYDRQLPPGAPGADQRYMGSPELADWPSKQMLIARCLRERGLQGLEAVFVDDHPSEVESVRGVCATVQVQPPRGMGQREIDLLWAMLLQGRGGCGSQASLGERGRCEGSPPTSDRGSFGYLEPASTQGTRADVMHGSGMCPNRLGAGHVQGFASAQQVSFLLAAPPLALPGDTGYKDHGLSHTTLVNPYASAESFVRPMPSLAGLYRDERNLRAMLEEHEGSFTETAADSEGNHSLVAGERRRKNPWCCSQ